jgi:hypothetical protein
MYLPRPGPRAARLPVLPAPLLMYCPNRNCHAVPQVHAFTYAHLMLDLMRTLHQLERYVEYFMTRWLVVDSRVRAVQLYITVPHSTHVCADASPSQRPKCCTCAHAEEQPPVASVDNKEQRAQA